MNLYIDGLSDNIRTVVARYRENVHCRYFTFERLCNFAKSKYEVYSACVCNITSSAPSTQSHVRSTGMLRRPQPKVVTRRHNEVKFVETDPTVEEKHAHSMNEDNEGATFTMETSTVPGDPNGELYKIGRDSQRRRVAPQLFNYDTGGTTCDGWVENKGRNVICSTCYYKYHIVQQCKVKLDQLDCVFGNYENLSADEHVNVQYTY